MVCIVGFGVWRFWMHEEGHWRGFGNEGQEPLLS